MRISFRPNPKTTGWPRRLALSILAGFATFMLSLPVGFFLFAAHFNHTTPEGTQNLLSAATAAMAVALLLGAMAAAGCLLLLLFVSALTGKPAA